jgi:hypothetical protein
MKPIQMIKKIEQKMPRKKIAKKLGIGYQNLTAKINEFNKFSEDDILKISSLYELTNKE